MPVRKFINENEKTADQLIGILLEYQQTKRNNYLSNEDLKAIANEMNLPESSVYSVAEFYSLLSTTPRGKHVIQICRDVPCYVSGEFNARDDLEKVLGIKMGETTKDGLFSLEYSSCLGYCEIAPVIRIDQKIYGNLNREKLVDIIAEYRRG